MAVYRSIDDTAIILQRDGYQDEEIVIVLQPLLGSIELLAT